MKKDQSLPNKHIYSNNSSGKPLPNNTNYTRNQSPYNSSYRGRSHNEETHKILHKIIIIDQIVKITIQDQIPMQHNLFLDPIPNQTQEINTIRIINHEIHYTTGIETIHIIEIEVIRTIEIRNTRTIDQEITRIIDQTITDQMTIIKTDHGTIHKIEVQVIIINIEIIPSHHMGIITIIIILNIDTEVVHQNIKDILIKYSQMKKQHQTPRY